MNVYWFIIQDFMNRGRGMNRLLLNDVNYKINKKLILKNINVEIKNGLIGILGPNGAGKSTLLKILVTLNKLKDGNIILNDYSYNRDIKQIRENLGYMPQNFSAAPRRLTGYEYLEYVACLRDKYDKKHIDEIVKIMNMNEFIHKRISSYSGGMKQKLGIAQSLIGYPSLIVLDEPTVGLDVEARSEIRKILYKISRDRIILVTSHIIEDIEDFSDKILILGKGELLFEGEVYSLIDSLKGNVFISKMPEKLYLENIDNIYTIYTKKYDDIMEVKYMSDKPITEKCQEYVPTLDEAYKCFMANRGNNL